MVVQTFCLRYAGPMYSYLSIDILDSSVMTHRRDTNLGMWTWSGLTSNSDATPPQPNASAPC